MLTTKSHASRFQVSCIYCTVKPYMGRRGNSPLQHNRRVKRKILPPPQLKPSRGSVTGSLSWVSAYQTQHTAHLHTSAIQIARRTAPTKRRKFIDVRCHLLQHFIEKQAFNVKYISTTEMPVDIPTKPKKRTAFEKHRLDIGVRTLKKKVTLNLPNSKVPTTTRVRGTVIADEKWTHPPNRNTAR